MSIVKKQFTLLFCVRGPQISFIYLPNTRMKLKQHNIFNKILTFTPLHLHLCMYLKFMDTYSIVLVGYVFEDECKNLIEYLMLFLQVPRDVGEVNENK